MPSHPFSYSQVADIAEKLLQQGTNPSLELVCQALNIDPNDASTINEHLTQWRDKKTKIVAKVKKKQKTTEVGLSEAELAAKNKESLISAYHELKNYTQQHIEELQKTLSVARATLESTADGIVMVNNEGKMIDWNKKFIEIARIPDDVLKAGDQQAALQHLLSIMADPQELINTVMRLAQDPTIKGNIGDCSFKDGRILERYSQPFIIDNEIAGRVYSFRDVTEKRKAEEGLRLRQRAIEASNYGVIITDAKEYKIIYVNPAFETITGYSAQEAIGRNCRFLQGKERDQEGLSKLRFALKEQKDETIELRNFRKDGELFWNELRISPVPDAEGNVTHYVGIITDITQRKAMEAQLRHQATHDKLTNLPNRTLLTDRVQQAIVRAKHDDTLIAILFLDLDRFKFVNDSLGHDTGDALLYAIAERLSDCIKYSDTVARMGGDEFIVVLTGLKKAEEAITVAKKILKKLDEPLYIQNRILSITTSIGISCYPKDGREMSTLFKHADIAMYKAKEIGGNNVQFYTAEMNARINQLLTLENNLRSAIKRKELVLYYQPVIDLETRQIIGAEALLRWIHAELGFISPLEFIPLAEETGLIIPIGEWVMTTACKQNKAWQKEGFPPIKTSINVSGRQIQGTNIPKLLSKVLSQVQIDPKYIEIELTESILMENPDEMVSALTKIKKMGVSLAIDDFGTGYSSLSYLKHFPVDKLKIDQSFIKDLNKNADDKAIVLAIIAMAKTLGLSVTAEGIETKKEADFLAKNFCDFGQGYYYDKPMDANDFTKRLKNQANLTKKTKNTKASASKKKGTNKKTSRKKSNKRSSAV